MGTAIAMLVISGIFFLLYRSSFKLSELPQDMKSAHGVIDGYAENDGPSYYYKLTVDVGGVMYRGISESYEFDSHPPFKEGDVVSLNYVVTKADFLRVYIKDDRLTPIRGSTKRGSTKVVGKWFRVLSWAFGILSLFLAIKEFM